MSVSDKDRAHMRRLGETLEATDYAHADSEIALALAAADRGEIVGVKLSHETVRRLAALQDPERGFPVSLSDAVSAVVWQAYRAVAMRPPLWLTTHLPTAAAAVWNSLEELEPESRTRERVVLERKRHGLVQGIKEAALVSAMMGQLVELGVVLDYAGMTSVVEDLEREPTV